MRFKKTISIALALVGLLLSLTACLNAPERQIQRTQLVMFKSLSFYMPEKSFEEVFGKADEVVEEEEMAYRDTWRAEDPYFYKTGRHFYYYENISWNDYTVRAYLFTNSYFGRGEGLFFCEFQSSTERTGRQFIPNCENRT